MISAHLAAVNPFWEHDEYGTGFVTMTHFTSILSKFGFQVPRELQQDLVTTASSYDQASDSVCYEDVVCRLLEAQPPSADPPLIISDTIADEERAPATDEDGTTADEERAPTTTDEEAPRMTDEEAARMQTVQRAYTANRDARSLRRLPFATVTIPPMCDSGYAASVTAQEMLGGCRLAERCASKLVILSHSLSSGEARGSPRLERPKIVWVVHVGRVVCRLGSQL